MLELRQKLFGVFLLPLVLVLNFLHSSRIPLSVEQAIEMGCDLTNKDSVRFKVHPDHV